MEPDSNTSAVNRREKVWTRLLVPLLTLCLLAMAGGFFLWSLIKPPPISATAPRDATAIAHELQPPEPVQETKALDLSQIQVSQDSNQVNVVFPSPYLNPPHAVSYQVLRLNPRQSVSLHRGALQLRAIGTAYADSYPADKRGEWSVQMEAAWFGADLAPLSRERIATMLASEWLRKVRYEGNLPKVRFLFQATPGSEAKILSIKLLDSRTGRLLSRGYSLGKVNDEFQKADVTLGRWHQGPVTVFLDVAHGPVVVKETEAKVGNRLQFGPWNFYLLAAAQGDSNSSSAGSIHETNRVTVNLVPSPDHSVFIFAIFPKAQAIPLDFHMLNAKKEKLTSWGGMTTTFVNVQEVKAPLEDVKAFQATHYTEVKRLVMELPELPGLPEENRSLENLMEVKLPRVVKVRNEWDLRELLEGTLQVRIVTTGTMKAPPGYFPRLYTNLTATRMIAELESFLPADTRIGIDTENFEVRTIGPWWKELLEKFESVFED